MAINVYGDNMYLNANAVDPAFDKEKKFTKVFYIDPVDGSNAYDGCYGFPFKDLPYALSVANNSGNQIVLAPGTYTEAVEINDLNCTITSIHPTVGGEVNYTGDVIVNNVSSSVRCVGISFQNIEHRGSGNLYLYDSRSVTFNKTGAGYTECEYCDMSVNNITGAGQTVITGCKTGLTTINNIQQICTIRDGIVSGKVTVTAGTFLGSDFVCFPDVNNGFCIDASLFSAVFLKKIDCSNTNGTLGRVRLLGSYHLASVIFDITNSTMTGTNLNYATFFDNIALKNISTVTGNTKCLVKNANGTIAEQVIAGNGLPTDADGLLSNVSGVKSWTKNIDVSSLKCDWVLANAYSIDQIVEKDGYLYKANNSIPANTAFTIGTTGATWKKMCVALQSEVISALGFTPIDSSYSVNGDVTGSLSNILLKTLNGLTAGTYTNANVTINTKGQVTGITNGSSAGGIEAQDANTIYVNPINGSDSNLGTIASKVNSIDYALSIINNGSCLSLDVGGYADFNVTNKTSVTIKGLHDDNPSKVVCGVASYNFECNNVKTQGMSLSSVFINSNCVFGTLEFSDIRFIQLPNASVVDVQATNLQPNSSITFKNCNFRTEPHQNDTSYINILPSTNSICTLYFDNCENVYLPTNIPTGWRIRWKGRKIQVPSNANSINFACYDVLDEKLDIFTENATHFNNANQLLRTNENNKILITQQNGYIVTDYNQANSYIYQKDIVIKDNQLYTPNSNISANTVFVEGTSGQTWKAIKYQEDKIVKILGNRNCLLALTQKGRVYGANGRNPSGYGAYPGNAALTSFEHYNGYGLERLRLLDFKQTENSNETAKAIDIAVSGWCGFVLMDSKELYSWGYSTTGVHAQGSTVASYFPGWATNNVEEIYTHPSHFNRGSSDYVRILVRKSDGYIYGAGYDGLGYLGLGTTTNKISFTRMDWCGTNPLKVFNLGSYLGCVVVQKSDYTIWVSGYNGSGGLGTGNTSNVTTAVNVTTAWMGAGNTNYVLKDCTGIFGYSDSGVIDYNSIVMWFTDNANTVDILRGCGNNVWNQIADGSTSNVLNPVTITVPGTGRITQISMHSACTLLIVKNNNLYGRGWNSSYFCGINTNSNITTTTWLWDYVDKVMVKDACNFSWDYQVSLIIKSTLPGQYYACGYNSQGQLGIGTNTNVTTWKPMRIPKEYDVVSIVYVYGSSGEAYTPVALTSAGDLLAWGYNTLNFIFPETSNAVTCSPFNIRPNILK